MVRGLRLQCNSKSNMNTSNTITAENIAIFLSTGTGGHRCTFLRWISLSGLKIYTYRRHRCTFLHRNSLQLPDFHNLTGRYYRIYNRLNIHNHHMTYYKNTGYNRKSFSLNRSERKTDTFSHRIWLNRNSTDYNTNWYYNDWFKLYKNTLLISNTTGF